MIVFLPVYLVLMLPCVLCQLIRKEKSGENVIKKFFNIDDNDDVNGVSDAEREIQQVENGKGSKEGFALTGDHLKSKLNTRRASSIDGENETRGKFLFTSLTTQKTKVNIMAINLDERLIFQFIHPRNFR